MAMESDSFTVPITTYYGGGLRYGLSDVPRVMGFLGTPRVYSCGMLLVCKNISQGKFILVEVVKAHVFFSLSV